MAKALYGTLFDWIVLQVNHALAIKQSNVKEVIFNIVLFITYTVASFTLAHIQGCHWGLEAKNFRSNLGFWETAHLPLP